MLVDDRRAQSRVHVDGPVELLHRPPENIVTRVVVREHRVAVLASALEVVQHDAAEVQLGDAAPGLLGGVLRVVHRDGRKGGEARRVLLDLLVDVAVRVVLLPASERE
jgi:hypothetical protein